MFLHENQVWKPIGEYVKVLLYPLLLGLNDNLSIRYVIVLYIYWKNQYSFKKVNFYKKLKPIVFDSILKIKY